MEAAEMMTEDVVTLSAQSCIQDAANYFYSIELVSALPVEDGPVS